MIQTKIKQVLINTLSIMLAFTTQDCVFPLLPFLLASLNLFSILAFSFGFIHGENTGIFCNVLSGLLLDSFYSKPSGLYTLIYIYINYANDIFTKYYYEDYITLPLIPSISNRIRCSIYIYVFRFLIHGRLNLLHHSGNIMLLEVIFTAVTTLLTYRLFLFTSGHVGGIGKRRGTKLV